MKHVGQADDERIEVDNFRFQMTSPGKGEQPLRQPRAEISGLLSFGKKIPLLLILQLHFEKLEIADDNRQQIIEVVGDTTR